MKKIVHHTLLATTISCCLTWPAFALAPVVDESENFALFDEQLAVAARPDAYAQTEATPDEDYYQDSNPDNNNNNNDTIALAHDDASNINNTSQDPSLLLSKLQGLQQELSELRGQLEVQTHALQTLKKQQLDFYQDLDKRLRDNPNTTSSASNHAANPIDINSVDINTDTNADTLTQNTAPRGNPADEQISYLAAYELVKNKEFDKGIMAMKHFIQQYPRGGYTANAHYWLGELYMVKQSFPDAIQQFETVLKTFPSSSKSSASSLKLGYALAASGQTNAARERLKAVIRDYPDTHAAQLATSKLESFKS
ncbi:MAG: tol-pal system protein YbgF [Legionella sp.]|nr:tol-pal system protein YbgF [Legionella sp.]